ncbi:DNA-3-methyladenine glycosylase I [Fusibacter sp. 3D3]|uniref:DNA-3-methyladenine glycosylase I n=1 Tax=Fusibacter sp. 3D3 TaxID=1048380 RepID=UPI0008538815|nr:DNA-3-methyladenine glycosylase I [Fusibacter sp. 3D3]GAU78974.1 DNA-3-methyladenine glycosylase [Fusibacter sp. 3D3]
MSKIRCEWALSHELNHEYHDKDWGVPVHDDRKLFEMFNLEGAQAGLSWLTILKRRADYNCVFEDFDPHKLATYTDEQLEAILLDARIIRNRLKVFSVRSNAVAYLKVVEEFGSFDAYIWQFVGGKPIVNAFKHMKEVPVSTPESDAMSKDLKKRGFKFCGTTICYAYMQAVGMVNDHTVDCFRYNEVQI